MVAAAGGAPAAGPTAQCPPGSSPAKPPPGGWPVMSSSAYCVANAPATAPAAAPGASPAAGGAPRPGSTPGGSGASATTVASAAPGAVVTGPSGGASAGRPGVGSSAGAGSPTTTPPAAAPAAEPPKAKPRPTFRKMPADPPPGDVSEGLTKSNGDYKCAPVNAYAKAYEKTVSAINDARMAAPWRSDERCQARCDLLAWRERLVDTFHYRGSWSCSVASVGIWAGADTGGDLRSYRNGDNDNGCTCVDGSDTPINFTP